jgi:hypothetical protein
VTFPCVFFLAWGEVLGWQRGLIVIFASIVPKRQHCCFLVCHLNEDGLNCEAGYVKDSLGLLTILAQGLLPLALRWEKPGDDKLSPHLQVQGGIKNDLPRDLGPSSSLPSCDSPSLKKAILLHPIQVLCLESSIWSTRTKISWEQMPWLHIINLSTSQCLRTWTSKRWTEALSSQKGFRKTQRNQE